MGENRMCVDRFFHRLKVTGFERRDLLWAGTTVGQCCLHCLEDAGFHDVPFRNPTSHQPLGEVGLENVVGEELPKRFLVNGDTEFSAVAREFGASGAYLVANRMRGSESFAQTFVLLDHILELLFSCGSDRGRTFTGGEVEQVAKKIGE